MYEDAQQAATAAAYAAASAKEAAEYAAHYAGLLQGQGQGQWPGPGQGQTGPGVANGSPLPPVQVWVRVGWVVCVGWGVCGVGIVLVYVCQLSRYPGVGFFPEHLLMMMVLKRLGCSPPPSPCCCLSSSRLPIPASPGDCCYC